MIEAIVSASDEGTRLQSRGLRHALNESSLASAIESILFVAGEPVTSSALATLLRTTKEQVESGLARLDSELQGRGVRIQGHGATYQLVTAPEHADVVRNYLRLPRQLRLSRPALETLAIIAYRQPVTRPEIEAVRGVGTDRVITNLLARDLIEVTGRRKTPGRAAEYGTTAAFLQSFGLASLEDLPPVETGGASSSGSYRQTLGLRNLSFPTTASVGKGQ